MESLLKFCIVGRLKLKNHSKRQHSACREQLFDALLDGPHCNADLYDLCALFRVGLRRKNVKSANPCLQLDDSLRTHLWYFGFFGR